MEFARSETFHKVTMHGIGTGLDKQVGLRTDYGTMYVYLCVFMYVCVGVCMGVCFCMYIHSY